MDNQKNEPIRKAQALWDYEGESLQSNLLSFKKGDIIKIIKSDQETNWWVGMIGGKTGFFPANYTRELLDLSDLKKTVKSIINTVFKQEALYGLNQIKESRHHKKRNSLPQLLNQDEIMERNSTGISSNFINYFNNSIDIKKKGHNQTVPYSFSKKIKKKTILPKKEDKDNIINNKGGEDDDDYFKGDLQRSFSDPCLNPNDPSKIKWKKTDVEQTVQVLTDVKSEDGRIIFRVKEQGNLTLKSIRSGSLEGIIEYFIMSLACDDEENNKMEGFTKEMDALKEEIKFFLCAHQRVITTDNLLNMMQKLHNEEVMPPPLPIKREGMDKFIGEYNSLKEKKQLGVFNLLSFWIQNSYYPDFVLYDGNPTSSVAKLHNFARSLPKDRKSEILQKINHQLPFITPYKPPSDNNRRIKSLPEFAIEIDFMELENRELAESLTRIDADMMRKITRGEFLFKNFENLKKELPSSHYIKYAERLRKLSLWASSQIVRETKKKMRAKVYKKLVQVAQICLELNNFSSLCAILAGIGSNAVRRLTETNKEVSHEIKQIVKELEEDFMGFSDAVPRNAIKHCIDNKKPCIPTIDLIRTDLLRIDEGAKGDYANKQKDHIKFFKIVSFGKAIHFIEQAYSHPFHFEGNKERRALLIDEFLTILPNTFKQKQVLMKFSFEAEPPTEREKKGGKYAEILKDYESK